MSHDQRSQQRPPLPNVPACRPASPTPHSNPAHARRHILGPVQVSSPAIPAPPWAWIQEAVAAEWGCEEDAVGTLEGEEGSADEGMDFVTVDGLPVLRVGLPAPEPVASI